MQVVASSAIASTRLREGDSLALAPCGRAFDPLPVSDRPDLDIAKIII